MSTRFIKARTLSNRDVAYGIPMLDPSCPSIPRPLAFLWLPYTFLKPPITVSVPPPKPPGTTLLPSWSWARSPAGTTLGSCGSAGGLCGKAGPVALILLSQSPACTKYYRLSPGIKLPDLADPAAQSPVQESLIGGACHRPSDSATETAW